MKVAGYARVSTDLQREKETIKTQIDLIERTCAAQGHVLVNIYCDDGVSGTIMFDRRDAGNRLMADARDGKFEGVVVYKADRIGRDVLVNETAARALFDELGIDIIGIAEQIDLSTPIGRAMFTFQSAIGRLERENTLQRSLDATLRYAREGVWLGGIVPFGYRIEGKDQEARLTVADEIIPACGQSEADVMREIYRMAGDDGLSCFAIADRLNALGVPTSYARDGRGLLRNKRRQNTQGVWRAARVRNMLVETTYRGLHQWGKRSKRRRANGAGPPIIERAVPALVSDELWHRAQATLRKHRFMPSNTEKRKYLLRGLIKCCCCGLTYAGTVNKSRKVEGLTPEQLRLEEVHNGIVMQRYYRCNGKNATHQIYGRLDAPCPSHGLRAEQIEHLIWNDIESFLRRPGAILAQLRDKMESSHISSGSVRQRLNQVQGSIASKEAERGTLLRLARRGLITDADLESQLAELVAEEQSLREGATKLENESSRMLEMSRSLLTVEGLLERLHDALDGELTWETRREIVEALVEGVEMSWVQEESGKVAPVARVRYSFEPVPLSVGEFTQAADCTDTDSSKRQVETVPETKAFARRAKL